MVSSLPRPGVEVVQELRETSPTILRPALAPCIVGPCFEIIDLEDSSGVANSNAVFTTPARIVGDAVGATITPGTDRALRVRVGGGAWQTYTLPDPTPATSYSLALAASLIQQNLNGVVATTTPDGLSLELRTSATGASASLELGAVANDAYTILGIDDYEDIPVYGSGGYENQRIWSSFASLPTDKGDIDQMDVQESSIRAYVLQGGQFEELLRDRAVLRHRWNQSATRLHEDGRYKEELNTFPVSTWAHQLTAFDDGDADGTTPWMYARGTNAFGVLGTGSTNYIYWEAKGDQDPADFGQYHGQAGNDIRWVWDPAGNAAAGDLVETAGHTVTLHPVIQITFTKTDGAHDPVAGDLVQPSSVADANPGGANPLAAAGPPSDWSANITNPQPTGVLNQWTAELYNLTGPTYTITADDGSDHDDITGDRVGVPWFAAIDAVEIITTASEMVAAIQADADASNLVNVEAPDGTGVMANQDGTLYALDNITNGGGGVGTETVDEIKVGDILEETTGTAKWTAVVRDIDDSNVVLVELLSGLWVPDASDTFTRLYHDKANRQYAIGALGSDAAAVATKYLSGGRDPIDFTAAPAAAQVTGDLVISEKREHMSAGLVKITGVTGTFTEGNEIRTDGYGAAANADGYALAADDECDGKILQVGTDYLLVGFNVGGDLAWLQNGVGIKEYTLDGTATGAEASVAEFHTVVTTNPQDNGGGWFNVSSFLAGETVEMTFGALSADTWQGVVESVTVVSGTVGVDAVFRLVLSNVVRSVDGGDSSVGLPTGDEIVGLTSGAGGLNSAVASHWIKTIPTAGTSMYVQISGSSEVEVTLEGWEDAINIRDAINTAVDDANYASVSAALGTMVVDNAALDLTSPLLWRPDTVGGVGGVGGQNDDVELSGEGIQYVFGDSYDSAYPMDEDDYPGTGLSWQFLNTKHFGASFAVAAGDVLYNGDTQLGTVASIGQLNIGGQIFAGSKLVLDTDAETSWTAYDNWYIMGMNLDEETAPGSYDTTRPYPDLAVFDTTQELFVRHNASRNFDGTPVVGANFTLYLTYKGLRLDVTGSATNPDLLIIEDTTDLENQIGPTRPDNPLAWGVYMAMLNAANLAIYATGVDAISSSAPDGTLLAYTRAAEFLENYDVYAIAPLTQERVVHQMFQLHVDTMSEAANKLERVVIVNEEQPTETVPTLVGSGTAETISTNVIRFDPADINVLSAMLAQDIDPTWTPTQFRDAGVYIDITSDNESYLVSSVAGQEVTVVVAHAPGQNSDGFYASANMPSLATGGETCSIYKRGAAITNNQNICVTLGNLASDYGDRRVLFVQPDRVSYSYNGVETEGEGYFACCCIAGQTAGFNPSQPLTNVPIVGLIRPKNSSDKFTERQMSYAAAGGVYWLIQDQEGGATFCRHQLTTKVSSIETREYSITKAVDFAAKFLRTNLKTFIGRYNITDNYLDTLSTVTQGLLEWLVLAETLAGAQVNNLVVDEDAPDTVLLDITSQVLYPANYLRITLVV